MKNLKKVLSSAIAVAMLCSVTVFNGTSVQAKEVPKYLKKEKVLISEACMYENKYILKIENRINYYEGKIQKVSDVPECGDKISKEEMYYHSGKNEGFIYNFKSKSITSEKSTEDEMERVIEKKYSSSSNIDKIIKSENGVYWGEFNDDYHKRSGVVSSKGDLIEVPYVQLPGNVDIKVYNNTVYALSQENDNYKLNVSTLSETKTYKIDTNTDVNLNYLYGLHVNNNGIYILEASEKNSSEFEICKLKLSDDKVVLTQIAKHKSALSPVAVDNNDNIWYLQDGLIYKIENDSANLKYEVDKDAYNLFVSNDNNLIVSGPYSNGENPDKWSTIINLSDKYTNGWAKEGENWYYYIDSQCVNSEWKQIDGKWYCFDVDGVMLTGWVNDDYENWYFLNSDGSMATGWKQLEEKWYYLKDNGQAVNGWNFIDGSWYYFNFAGSSVFHNDSSMVTGWKQVDGEWYYLNDNGSMATGWKQIGGAWYYMYSNGTMAHDTTIEGYKLGSNGAML